MALAGAGTKYNARGMIKELVTELFEQAPCEVIVDFIASQSKPHGGEDEGD